MTAHPNPPAVVPHGGSSGPPTVMGQAGARIPAAGKIRTGIKVLSKRAAGEAMGGKVTKRPAFLFMQLMVRLHGHTKHPSTSP